MHGLVTQSHTLSPLCPENRGWTFQHYSAAKRPNVCEVALECLGACRDTAHPSKSNRYVEHAIHLQGLSLDVPIWLVCHSSCSRSTALIFSYSLILLGDRRSTYSAIDIRKFSALCTRLPSGMVSVVSIHILWADRSTNECECCLFWTILNPDALYEVSMNKGSQIYLSAPTTVPASHLASIGAHKQDTNASLARSNDLSCHWISNIYIQRTRRHLFQSQRLD